MPDMRRSSRRSALLRSESFYLFSRENFFGLVLRVPTTRDLLFSVALPIILISLASYRLIKYVILLHFFSGDPPPPRPGRSSLITLVGGVFLTSITLALFRPASVYV
jgi:hypothetical protein